MKKKAAGGIVGAWEGDARAAASLTASSVFDETLPKLEFWH